MKRGSCRFQSVVLRNAFGWARRALAHIHARIFPVPLGVEQAAFIESNRAFWNNEFRPRDKPGVGYVFVLVESHPAIYLSDASFAAIVGAAKGLSPLFVTLGFKGSISTQILDSYRGAAFVYIRSLQWLWMQLIAVFQAIPTYFGLVSPRELLNLRIDGIRFGDVLYDGVLAEGFATISAIDYRTFIALQRFYFLRSFIRHIARTYKIQVAVVSHTVGMRSAVFVRYLLREGIEVINRIGSHQILAKKYQSLMDVGTYAVKPEPHYFRLMVEGDDGRILRLAEEYIERRFSQQVDHLAVALAFNTEKAVYSDRSAFCRAVGLEPGRPIVFVMLHAFNDYPHSHFAKPMLFQDYYVWFRRTLEIARQTPDVNWVFKEHPAAAYYVTKDVDLQQVFAGVTDAHVRFLPAAADFNARSIPHVAHGIITCVGTAGLEYATCGIPCVLGGESPYSGLGFTIEPDTPEAYEACLRQIVFLPRLSAGQVVRAKLAAYFFFCVMESARYHFCPKFTDSQLSEWNSDLSARLWREAAAQFSDPDHVRRLRVQVGELGRFVLDSDCTQYVDFRQFPFLGEQPRAAGLGSRVVESGEGKG
jgi:hypothetical protein